MTIEHRIKPVSEEHLQELELLVKLLERHQDHIEIGCCVGCGPHPVAFITGSGSRLREQDEAGITPHIALYQEDQTTVYWYEDEDEEDEEDWDQYRNDRQKSE